MGPLNLIIMLPCYHVHQPQFVPLVHVHYSEFKSPGIVLFEKARGLFNNTNCSFQGISRILKLFLTSNHVAKTYCDHCMIKKKRVSLIPNVQLYVLIQMKVIARNDILVNFNFGSCCTSLKHFIVKDRCLYL